MKDNVQNKTKSQKKGADNPKPKKQMVVRILLLVITAIIGVVIGLLIAGRIFSSRRVDDLDSHRVDDLLDSRRYIDIEMKKPIIYLYPEEETALTVRLGAPERITASYPKYVNGWNVIAYPNGDLIDKSTGKKLYSLYWEGERKSTDIDKSIGFVVKGADAAEFLAEKLGLLGLNYKEREEFIVYWLPKLEAHEYNYIYFETKEEIEADMPLEFSVQPDTVIRVMMVFEGIEEYREAKEQHLTPAPERTGFTAVEWGGTEL